MANTNDTVEVQNGVYKESPVRINKTNYTKRNKFSYNRWRKKDHVINIISDGVQIEGFIIINGGLSDIHEFAGIHAEGISNCKIKTIH